MGYTTQDSDLLIGLGVSAISDLGNAFAQNDKTLNNYYAQIHEEKLAIKRGFFLSGEDIVFRKYIKDICCNGLTVFSPATLPLLKEFCFPGPDRTCS
jgi:oxygen-independent coproporphyrinogen-3 oxidase